MVLNVATLASVLRAEDDDNVIDIRLLSAHLGEGKIDFFDRVVEK